MDAIKILFVRNNFSQFENRYFIKTLHHIWRMQIISTLFSLLLIGLTATYLARLFYVFDLTTSYEYRTSFILVYAIFALFVSGLTNLYSIIVYRKTALIANPLIKSRSLLLSLGFFTFGIATIFFTLWFVSIFKKSHEQYTYESPFYFLKKTNTFVDAIQMFVLLIIGALWVVCFALEVVFYLEADITGTLWSYYGICLFIPFFYIAWLAFLFSFSYRFNWRWLAYIGIMGLWGVFLFPITIVLLIIKMFTNKSQKQTERLTYFLS